MFGAYNVVIEYLINLKILTVFQQFLMHNSISELNIEASRSSLPYELLVKKGKQAQRQAATETAARKIIDPLLHSLDTCLVDQIRTLDRYFIFIYVI